MYKIERREEIIEQFELGDTPLQVKIVPLDMYQRFTKAQAILIEEHKKNQQRKAERRLPTEDESRTLGLAVMEFIAATMGDDNAEQIITYFADDYEEMIDMVFPFINGVLVPRIQNEVRKIRDRKTAQYTGKGNRQQRRWFQKFGKK